MATQQYSVGVEQQSLPEQKKGIFGGHKPQQIPEIAELTNEIKDIGRRLRTLEERYSNLQTKTQITEQNMISRHKQVSTEIKSFGSEVNDVKKDVMDVKDKILMIIKEIQGYAKSEDVKVLERYISYWQPLNFVTRNEVKDIIEEILKERGV